MEEHHLPSHARIASYRINIMINCFPALGFVPTLQGFVGQPNNKKRRGTGEYIGMACVAYKGATRDV